MKFIDLNPLGVGMAKRRGFSLILLICIVLVAAGAAFFVLPNWLGKPPVIEIAGPGTHLGINSRLTIKVSAPGSGLKKVRAELLQGSRSKVLAEEDFSGSNKEAAELKLTIKPRKLGLEQGKASLVVSARDQSYGDWFQGKQAVLRRDYLVDTTPPSLSVLNRMIHINRGGAGLAVYRLSKDATQHGVMVGENRFLGNRPFADHPLLGVCVFAYSQAEQRGAKILAWAQDEAGNKTQAALNARVRWKHFRKDKITLSDRLLSALAAKMAGAMPKQKNDLEAFLYINTTLRKLNNQAIRKQAVKTSNAVHWQKVFLRPRGKPMARFGDRRTYFYQGKEVSKAVHLGYDLADVAQSPIPAVAGGKVTYAGDMGIYGNCVILDHGLGVSSLYGHMSQLLVSAGQTVKRGQELGRSGATGLALGDHLHFSVLVGGVYVNPTEWWDPHWMQDNIKLHLGEAGVKVKPAE